jgi:hydrogenase maturation protein HypF
VPEPLIVPLRAPRPVLGAGGDLKNALCLLDGDRALFGPHVGALAQVATQAHWRASAAALAELAGVAPAVVACDAHPRYASRALAARLGLPVIEVQHHHAHVAACLAENGERGPAIGIAFDGTGYGDDGAIWGGEALVADLCRAERVGHLESLPLAGGDAAVRAPRRVAAAYELALLGTVDARTRAALGATQVAVLERMLARGLNTVPTSSAGRLFDAAAAILGLGEDVTYEGQAAMRLEALARRRLDPPTLTLSLREREPVQATRCITRFPLPQGAGQGEGVMTIPYPFALDAGVVRLRALLAALLADRDAGVDVAATAARFHATMVAIVVALARHARDQSGLATVALGGGCFQNRLLLDGSVAALRADGFRVLVHRRVPANDGGLALGQAVVAAARLMGEAG